MTDSPKNSSEITGERYAPISIAHSNSNARVQPRKKFNFTESRANTEQESAAEAKASSQHTLDLPSFDQLPHTRPSHNTTLTTTPNGAHSTIGQPRNTEQIVQVGTHNPPSRTTVFPPSNPERTSDQPHPNCFFVFSTYLIDPCKNKNFTRRLIQRSTWVHLEKKKSFAKIKKSLNLTEILHLDEKRNARRWQSDTNWKHKKIGLIRKKSCAAKKCCFLFVQLSSSRRFSLISDPLH